MEKIYLVRHGQSEDNADGILGGRRDAGLTELGRRQAEHIAQELVGREIDVIYSSPLKRAYETARIIAERLGIADIETDERLMERDFGILTGHPYADVEKLAHGMVFVDKVGYFQEADGAETFPDVLARAQEFVDELKAKFSEKNILIVAHSDVGKMIRAAYNDWDWEEGLLSPNISNSDAIELTENRLVYKKQIRK
jgi:broad specificity phosphatase PhoE